MPVYNIPLLNKDADEVLVLDRTTMAYVFTGNISMWNDPRILALQTAGVKAKMQNEERVINLVVRDDSSGSTEVLTKSLNLFSAGDFQKYAGTPSSSKTVWNGVVAAHGKSKVQYKSGAEGVAAGVLLTPWSIGYSSSGEAELHSLPIPRFRQNDRQRAPIKAGTMPMCCLTKFVRAVEFMTRNRLCQLTDSSLLISNRHQFYRLCHA